MMTDDLNILSSEELGHLFPVVIIDYNPEWPGMYLLEKQIILSAAVSGSIVRIEHIGSTAVPGLCAKPTIDILVEISCGTDCGFFVTSLEKIQYRFIPKPENPPPHMMLAKGYSNKGLTGQPFHIHVRYPGIWDELIFRDYLIKYPDTARKYAELKRMLASVYPNDREKYTDSKSDFIISTTKKAREDRNREKDFNNYL